MAKKSYITPGANQDITSQTLTNDYQEITVASTVALTVTDYHTVVELIFNPSAGIPTACTVTINTTGLAEGYSLDVLIPHDLTSPGTTCTFTFSTGFKMPTNTLAVTSGKFGAAKFTYFTDSAGTGYWLGSTTLSAS